MDDTTNKGTERRGSEAIRREIEHTRAEMEATVDELGDRLTPGQIVDDLWHRFRSGNGGPGMGDAVKDHPVPFALMALGVGLLMVERTRPAGVNGNGRTAGKGAWYIDPDQVHIDLADKVKDKFAAVEEHVSESAEGAREKIDDLALRMREMKDEAAVKTSELKEEVSARAQQTKQGVTQLMSESPMAVGALTFGLGLMSGLSVPSTPAEDRLMGSASDTLKEEAKRVGKDAAESVRHIATDAVEAAKDEVRHVKKADRNCLEDMQEAARRVAESAKGAARERAEDDVETLKDELRTAARRTRRSMKARGKG